MKFDYVPTFAEAKQKLIGIGASENHILLQKIRLSEDGFSEDEKFLKSNEAKKVTLLDGEWFVPVSWIGTGFHRVISKPEWIDVYPEFHLWFMLLINSEDQKQKNEGQVLPRAFDSQDLEEEQCKIQEVIQTLKAKEKSKLEFSEKIALEEALEAEKLLSAYMPQPIPDEAYEYIMLGLLAGRRQKMMELSLANVFSISLRGRSFVRQQDPDRHVDPKLLTVAEARFYKLNRRGNKWEVIEVLKSENLAEVNDEDKIKLKGNNKYVQIDSIMRRINEKLKKLSEV